MPTITLCRFDANNKLSLQKETLESSSYIAISHIWAQASWTKIPGIAREVIASPQKVIFIQEKLPALVGTSLFWMDILAVDQTSKEARLSVVGHIPAVYRNATKTIVVREDGGFGPCCESLLGLLDDEQWNVARIRRPDETLQDYNVVTLATKHLESHHPHGLHESWSRRLWPLQETNLSQTIVFTVCENIKPVKTSVTWREVYGELVEVDKAAEAWVERGQFIWRASKWDRSTKKNLALKKDFLLAMLSNGTVTRSSKRAKESNASVFHKLIGSLTSLRGTTKARDFILALLPWSKTPPNIKAQKSDGTGTHSSKSSNESNTSVFHILVGSLTSFRETTKARDFVLALFPSHPWYKIPPNVKDITFGELWVDCVTQLQRFHEEPYPRLSVRPKLTLGIMGHTDISVGDSRKPSADVPSPRVLGDFARLAHYLDDRKPYLNASRGATWNVKKATDHDDIDHILAIVSETVMRSRQFIFHEWIRQYGVWTENQKANDEALLRKLRLQGLDGTRSQESDSEVRRLEYELAILGDTGAAKCFTAILGMYARLDRELGEESQVPRFASASWKQIVTLAKEHDTPFWRTTFLQLAAIVSCGLGFNALTWSRDKLHPYIISNHKPGPLSGSIQTLMLASPKLTIDESDEISVFTNAHDPYVVRKSAKDNGASRVIGAAIEWHDNERKDFKFSLHEGCPLALPCHDPRFSPIEWLRYYEHFTHASGFLDSKFAKFADAPYYTM